MALDESKESDEVFEKDGFTYLIDKAFLEKIKPVKIDFLTMGFHITSSLELGGGGCGSCSTSGTCS